MYSLYVIKEFIRYILSIVYIVLFISIDALPRVLDRLFVSTINLK